LNKKKIGLKYNEIGKEYKIWRKNFVSFRLYF